MKVTIADLKQAITKTAPTDPATALKLGWRLVDAVPHDIEGRLWIADLLVQLGAPQAAGPVYEAIAQYGIRGGHPLVSLVAAKVLEDSDRDVSDFYRTIARFYGAGSSKVSAHGQRTSPEHPDTLVQAPDLETEISLPSLIAGAARAAANLDGIEDYPETLLKIPLLSELPEPSFVKVCETIRCIRLPAGSMVIREGEMGRSFFWLARGSVSVYKTDMRGRQTELAQLGEGALFGEMALIQAAPRSASVQTRSDADLLEVDSAALSTMAEHLDAVALALDRFARERLLNNLLATSALFVPFSRKQRMDLLRRFTGHEVAPGTIIINEGDEGRGLYVVLSGEVEITKEQEGEQVPLATLKAGDIFGEIALLKGFPATATVTATRRSTILFLDRTYFKRLVNALPEIRAMFENMTEERLRDTQMVLADDMIIEASDDLVLI
ncbi:MAG: cyclic nucleotide-binding domain-containing protein [Deltaproteobacteria bacterium]|nr:cyclic nucleotide-binding domain-containing protein [Deltaproteobacteria bacterium]